MNFLPHFFTYISLYITNIYIYILYMHIYIYIYLFIYLHKDSSAKYHQNNKERLQKKLVKDIKVFLTKKKKETKWS